MTLQTKIHDGVIAALILISSALTYFVHPLWILLAVATGLIMVQSLFTSFCPVHYSVNKLFPPKKGD